MKRLNIMNKHGIILCGGKGSRLGNAGKKIPKTLFEIEGKAMIAHIFERFESAKLDTIDIAVGYLGDQIDSYMADHFPNSQYSITNAGEEASMLTRIAKSLKTTGHSIIMYGDTYIDINYDDLMNTHLEKNKACTLIVGEGKSPWGVLDIDQDGVILDFVEKPTFTYYIGGLVLNNKMNEELKNYLADDHDAKGFIDFIKMLIAKKQVASFLHTGFNTTFNSLVELSQAKKEFKEYLTSGD